MRVLHVTSDYVPNPLWGMGWHVAQIVSKLANEDVAAFVATASKSAHLGRNIITTSAETDRRYLSSSRYKIFDDFEKFNTWQERLAEVVIDAGLGFDLIHCHNWMSWITARRVQEHYSGVKIVVTFHFLQKQYEMMKENPVLDCHAEIIQLEKEAAQSADALIVLSDLQLNLLTRKYQFSQLEKVRHIPHSVDFEIAEFEVLHRSKMLNPWIDILYVGRLDRDKGISELLECFRKLTHRDVRLHVVGDGELFPFLQKEFKHPRIIFHGYLSRESLQELLRCSHIFCLPTTAENLPLAVIEAMLFGVVPVLTSGATVPYIFENGIHGLTTELIMGTGNVSVDSLDLLQKLEFLVSNKTSRYEFSARAYEYARMKYCAQRSITSLVQLYSNLCCMSAQRT